MAKIAGFFVTKNTVFQMTIDTYFARLPTTIPECTLNIAYPRIICKEVYL